MRAKMIDRRGFIGTAVGAAVASSVRAGAAPQAPASPAVATRVDPADYITLGRTGVRVSKAAAGLSLKPQDLVAAADAGINYFDTAEKYLNGEHAKMVGQALKGRPRKDIFVSAKFQAGLQNELTASTDEVVKRFHTFLEWLGTDYIDCMLIHNVQNPAALENPAWLNAFKRLKDQGRVRFLGASSHDAKLQEVVAKAVQSNLYDLLLLAYNPTTEGDLYGSAGWPELPELLADAKQKGIAVSTMKIMIGAVAAGAVSGLGPDAVDPNDIVARGKYLDARVAASRWVLSNPNVDVVQYTMTGPGTVAAAVETATTPFREADAELARAHHRIASGLRCPIPCSAPCQSACPADVAIADVLRHRMYYEHYGLQKQAMLEYASLPAPNQAIACATCESQACLPACPEGVPVNDLIKGSHQMLSLA